MAEEVLPYECAASFLESAMTGGVVWGWETPQIRGLGEGDGVGRDVSHGVWTLQDVEVELILYSIQIRSLDRLYGSDVELSIHVSPYIFPAFSNSAEASGPRLSANLPITCLN
jgi:hypothetical protein